MFRRVFYFMKRLRLLCHIRPRTVSYLMSISFLVVVHIVVGLRNTSSYTIYIRCAIISSSLFRVLQEITDVYRAARNSNYIMRPIIRQHCSSPTIYVHATLHLVYCFTTSFSSFIIQTMAISKKCACIICVEEEKKTHIKVVYKIKPSISTFFRFHVIYRRYRCLIGWARWRYANQYTALFHSMW